VQASFLLGGKGVELSSDILHPAQDVVGIAFLSAFEEDVFYKMGIAPLRRRLIPGAGIHEQRAMGDRRGSLLMNDPDAVGQGVNG
jgi:hypothetical protein